MSSTGKDEIFGENPCVYPTVGRSNCRVRALTYCDLHRVHRDDLLDVLDFYPEFRASFINNLEISHVMRDVSIMFGMDVTISSYKYTVPGQFLSYFANCFHLAYTRPSAGRRPPT